MYVLQLMDWYSASFSVLFIAVVECIVINWIYSKYSTNIHVSLLYGAKLCNRGKTSFLIQGCHILNKILEILSKSLSYFGKLEIMEESLNPSASYPWNYWIYAQCDTLHVNFWHWCCYAAFQHDFTYFYHPWKWWIDPGNILELKFKTQTKVEMGHHYKNIITLKGASGLWNSKGRLPNWSSILCGEKSVA